jgi:uncharacterized MAPEG superfamily protein
MTTELWILAACALMAPLLTFPILVGRATTPGGTQWGLGNRDAPMEFPDWVRRAERAHGNLLENLPTFAVFVLIAHLTQVHTSLTVAGATLFLVGRVLHAGILLAGVKVVRTLVFLLAQVGSILIFVELVRAGLAR